jgi:hypothetical protein
MPLVAVHRNRESRLRIGEVDSGDELPVVPDAVLAFRQRQSSLSHDAKEKRFDLTLCGGAPRIAQVEKLVENSGTLPSLAAHLLEPRV